MNIPCKPLNLIKCICEMKKNILTNMTMAADKGELGSKFARAIK